MSRDDEQAYFNLPQLARYSGLSISTLQRLLKHPTRPLPHSRLMRGVSVSKADFDAYVAAARVMPDPVKVEAPRPRGVKSPTELATDAADIVRSIRGGRR